MTEWIEARRQLPPEGREVLGMYYTNRSGWRPMICKVLARDDKRVHWTINGASGPGIHGPKWWMPIPESPETVKPSPL